MLGHAGTGDGRRETRDDQGDARVPFVNPAAGDVDAWSQGVPLKVDERHAVAARVGHARSVTASQLVIVSGR